MFIERTIPLSAGSDIPCFALLDDCDAASTSPCSRLYTDYIETLYCNDVETLDAVFAAMQTRLLQGLHVVALFSYEFGLALQKIESDGRDRKLSGLPGEYFSPVTILCFKRCRFLDTSGVDEWLAQTVKDIEKVAEPIGKVVAGVINLSSNVNASAFTDSIERIHDYLESGDAYQINYTYRLSFDSYGPPAALYRRLRQRQPAPFGAFIGFPDGHAVLSFSPELFLRHEQGRLTARPMKGTAAAGNDIEQESATSASLAADPKNRAENLMIVDLLRNDLGRIAVTGSVNVPHLFQVAKHGAVLQMTSTVTATIDPSVTLPEIVSALFPCGSITGAPKRRAMMLIDELEPDRRGIYTGAIGWFDAPKSSTPAIGDFCLSVPIRTLTLGPVASHGLRAGSMGVGAGIVYDSVAPDEYAECVLKASFLTALPAEFTLFETMRGNRQVGVPYRHLHLARLQRSAAFFGFSIDIDELQEQLANRCAALSDDADYRIRLTLRQAGDYEIETMRLTQLTTSPVRLVLAASATNADDLFLQHKTSVRERYDAAWRNAEAMGAFDMIFCNSNGEVTEGARSTIFAKKNGRWMTPPLAAGVLPGVMRSVLLSDKNLATSEQRFSMEDLRNADEIFVCNALRGIIPAFIDWDCVID